MNNPITLTLNADPLILSALREDITSEDVSTNSVAVEKQLGEADLICKEDGIICGLEIFARVFTLLDSTTRVTFFAKDGDTVTKGQLLAKVTGDIRTINLPDLLLQNKIFYNQLHLYLHQDLINNLFLRPNLLNN